jgi:hypothetical protein
MLEHADAALESWFAHLPVDVIFEPLDDGRSKRPTVSLLLHNIRERTEQRDNEVLDVRDADGRVIGRQRSDRFFELDYLCRVGGDHRAAHAALGSIIQTLVDVEQIPDEHVPAELAELGHPLDVHLVSSSSPGVAAGGIVIQLVVPVRPAAEREIGPPAEHLHLEMKPPPGATAAAAPSAAAVEDPESGSEPLERKWTTVRRREMIAVPLADEDTA